MTVLAHGLGGSADLPIPLSYALIGAAWALTATFAVVALAWRRPKFDPDNPGRPVPAALQRVVDSPVTRQAVALLALLFTVWVVLAAIFGPQNAENALPGTFYVLLWVGLVVVSVLFGPVWRAVSPLRTVSRVLPKRAVRYPDWLGYWPAAFGLFAFVWLELASPDPGSLSAIKTWLVGYAVIVLGGALIFGDRWFARADPFEVYSVAVSRLSPWWRHDAKLVVGNPFHHLPTLPVRSGTVAVLAVLLGSTAFDSFAAGPSFRSFLDDVAPTVGAATAVKTTVLLLFVAIVGGSFWLAAQATGGVDRAQRRALPGLLAHSLIPIVVGYILAHYFNYLIERGQQTLIYLADPFDLGWTLFGWADGDVNYLLSRHQGALATVKVAFVVLGHMGGVIAAHDKALAVLPQRHRLTGQLAMMLVMVFYTFTGLYLLFGG